ncbi:MAG: adenylate/guanylate cyclase domain-containing protein [Thermoanaerobaculia bacterium]
MTDEERTIAFADLSGFTALTEAHGDEIGTAIALRFYDMTRSLLRNGAALVKTIGDAVMIAAPDPATAVEIVLELQTLTDSTPNFPMIRAGLHVGPAREEDKDYFGASVNLAARVAAYARSGQILCTAAVASRVAESSPCTLVQIGPVSLRNVHDPVVIYEVRNRAVVAAATHIDPICRMHVSSDAAVARVKSGTTEYYFCSFPCLRTFVVESPLVEDHA